MKIGKYRITKADNYTRHIEYQLMVARDDARAWRDIAKKKDGECWSLAREIRKLEGKIEMLEERMFDATTDTDN